MRKKSVISASANRATKLRVLAKKKEHVRLKLAVTAEQLRLKAKQLAKIAKAKESVRSRLAVTAKAKESVKSKLAVTAGQLRLKAKQLATIAKERESVKKKLAITAEQLRLKAKQLAVIAKEKESVRSRLATIAKEKESVRSRLAVIAKEKESVKKKLAVTAEQLRLKAEILEQIKAKDEAIISSIGDGLVVTDKIGRIVLVNKVFEKTLGWKEREIEGKVFTKIVPMVGEDGKDIPASERLVTQTLENRLATTNTGNYLRKDGSSFPVVSTVSAIVVEGKFVGTVGIFHDITKEKEIDKAKTEFVALASHQLRTPLSSVNWYSEMLLSGDAGPLNEAQKKYLNEVYKGNQRMVALVNALLNVSRIELGTFTVDPAPTDVVKLAERAIDELKVQIDQRHLRFDNRHGERLPLLNTDSKLLGMVFQNLLSNAIKYTPERGKVSLDLHIVKRGESVNGQKMKEDGIVIIVSDNGYGIPKSQQDKIFTKLFRADNVREMDTEGTGLGLYIVKSVVDDSGGKIWFESEENKGTTFYVTLPMAGMKKKEGTKTLETH